MARNLILAGQPAMTERTISVRDKYTDEIVDEVCVGDQGHLDQAISSACEAAEAMRRLPACERARILSFCATKVGERAEELAIGLCAEAGKPIRDARGEVARLIDTFEIASAEATRMGGEVIEMAVSPRAIGYRGMTRCLPVGAVGLITPFNFPLNLVAHKVAPAIATGCPFVLKPASNTPIGALILGEIIGEAGLPPGSFSIVPCDRTVGERLATDDRLKLLSFTGSPDVGWRLKELAGKKKVVLELGGNAACVIDDGVDINDAVKRVVIGAFYQSGQSCISVQRILVHVNIYAPFRDALVEAVQSVVSGDPRDEDTLVGPVISKAAADRIETWVQQAMAAGAQLLCGGQRVGNVIDATLLEKVARDEPVSCQEVFGPVATLSSFTSFDDALAEVNASRYGLQAGVFTPRIDHAMQAWDELDVGGVMINEIPSWRVDHMPYGGVKDSGIGREGVRYAMEDMTEPRLLVIRDVPHR